MTREDITDRACRLVRDQWSTGNRDACPPVEMATTFTDDLAFDSLDMIELIMAFEEEFDLEVADNEAEDLLTVGQAVDYLARRLEVPA